ncbi:MAG: hypothetical protein KDE53_38165, partial [Caldilineaceae bacterium]|nr:hypothetical protein [Caldilineaceae bacterium]
GSYLLQGTVSDDSTVDKVEVQLDGGGWQQAQLSGTNWSLAIAPQSLANPDGGNLAIDVQATDKAGRTGSSTANVLVDVTPLDAFISTATIISSGALIAPDQIINDLNVRLTWPAIPGAASIYAGWTNASTPTLGSLTAYGAGAGSHDQSGAEGSALYAHVIAVDSNGNQTASSSGPYGFDGPRTPDLIADLARDIWVASGGKQVGQMITGERGVQQLFAGWDTDQLRLRWQGVNLGSGDDLYLYLETGGGGSTDLYNPYGTGQSGQLPFAANYMVRLSAGISPTLYVAGGGWTPQGTVSGVSRGDRNDLLLPFSLLGISNPAGSSLKLLGVASQNAGQEIWATIPDKNLGRSWNQYIEFAALGAGIVPADGVWADAQLAVAIAANPSPDQLVGVGDTMRVTVTVQNVGSAPLPQLTIAGTTSGGVALGSGPQVAANIPVSGTAQLLLTGAVNGDGTLALTLADSYHRPYQLETLAYTVDNTPPINVSVVISAANPGKNIAIGFAEDDSAIGQFALEVNGAAVPCVGAGVGYLCEWDAGNASEGSSFTLRGRATDVHGNVGLGNNLSVQVDATLPILTLSAASQTALSDGRINNRERTLTGTLTDNVAGASVQLCSDDGTSRCSAQAVAPDNSWTLLAPALGDGVTTTLTIVGYDLAGNGSQPLSQPVIVDSVNPQLTLTSLNPGTVLSSTAVLLASGTVTDGGGVAAVRVYLVKPDGSSTIVPATLSGTNWSVPYYFDQTGDYQAVAVATDLAGNRGTLVLGTFTADAMPGLAVLTTHVVGSGVVTPAGGQFALGTVVTITATADVSWTFAGWSGDLSGNANPTTITLDGSKVITATFTEDVVLPPGDINGDDTVNVLDLQATINMILNGTQPDDSLFALEWWQRADLNNDGQWNVLDLQLLINLIQAAP